MSRAALVVESETPTEEERRAALVEALRRSLDPHPEGIQYGVPAVRYHGWPFVSNSKLARFARSPAHFFEDALNPKASTPAQNEGSALHTLTLEPDLFTEQYIVVSKCSIKSQVTNGKPCDATAKIVRQGGVPFCGRHDPGEERAGPEDARTVLNETQFTLIQAQREALLANPDVRTLIEQSDAREASAVWRDAETGLTCKMRADLLIPAAGMVGDLKRCQDARRAGFQRMVAQRGYHRQHGFYLNGLSALQPGAYEDFVFVVVEEKPPHGVKVWRLGDRTVRVARYDLRALLNRMRECIERGEFPAYSEGISDLELPDYILDDIYDEE